MAARARAPPPSPQALHAAVGREMRAAIAARPGGARPEEHVARWALLPPEAAWGPDDGMLTRTLKLRRSAIEARHAAEIRELYRR